MERDYSPLPSLELHQVDSPSALYTLRLSSRLTIFRLHFAIGGRILR